MKAELDNIVLRFGIYSTSRGICNDCDRKADTVLVRIFSPIKEELRICHSCLIQCVREIKYRKHSKKTSEQIKQTRLDNLAKARAARKEKKEKNGLLPQVLDNVKGGKPTPAKKNDGTGDTAGGTNSLPDRPSSVYQPSQEP